MPAATTAFSSSCVAPMMSATAASGLCCRQSPKSWRCSSRWSTFSSSCRWQQLNDRSCRTRSMTCESLLPSSNFRCRLRHEQLVAAESECKGCLLLSRRVLYSRPAWAVVSFRLCCRAAWHVHLVMSMAPIATNTLRTCIHVRPSCKCMQPCVLPAGKWSSSMQHSKPLTPTATCSSCRNRWSSWPQQQGRLRQGQMQQQVPCRLHGSRLRRRLLVEYGTRT